MEKFSTIFHRAANRHGGADALNKIVRERLAEYEPTPLSDDRWLAQLTKRLFVSGFNWNVVHNKWDGFEKAFWNFDVGRCARMDMDDLERLTSDRAIVRNASKIKAVAVNAQMILKMAEEKGSADAFIRGWPMSDYQGLLDYMNKHGSMLGPNTVSFGLRFCGVPSYILSKDVTAALKHAGIIDKPVTSKTAKKAVQQAFNAWVAESGEDLSYISRVLALSIDG